MFNFVANYSCNFVDNFTLNYVFNFVVDYIFNYVCKFVDNFILTIFSTIFSTIFFTVFNLFYFDSEYIGRIFFFYLARKKGADSNYSCQFSPFIISSNLHAHLLPRLHYTKKGNRTTLSIKICSGRKKKKGDEPVEFLHVGISSQSIKKFTEGKSLNVTRVAERCICASHVCRKFGYPSLLFILPSFVNFTLDLLILLWNANFTTASTT